jgi:hypothetical protein
MQAMAKFGLFDDAPLEILKTGEPVTWATLVNSIAQGKGFLDTNDYFVKTFGEQQGKVYLQKLQR